MKITSNISTLDYSILLAIEKRPQFQKLEGEDYFGGEIICKEKNISLNFLKFMKFLGQKFIEAVKK